MKKTDKETSDNIVSVARNLFAQFGFKKTTMDDIAKAVHKGKSSLYHYFKSKEEVFQAVLEEEIYILKDEIDKAISKEDSPQQQLKTYVITRMKVIKRLANFYSALKDELYEHYGFIEKVREKYLQDEIETIKSILKAGVDKEIFYLKELEITASAVITALRGFEYNWAFKNEVTEIEKRIDSLFDVLFYGIIKR